MAGSHQVHVFLKPRGSSESSPTSSSSEHREKFSDAAARRGRPPPPKRSASWASSVAHQSFGERTKTDQRHRLEQTVGWEFCLGLGIGVVFWNKQWEEGYWVGSFLSWAVFIPFGLERVEFQWVGIIAFGLEWAWFCLLVWYC